MKSLLVSNKTLSKIFRILGVFRHNIVEDWKNSIRINGIVEMDETFLPKIKNEIILFFYHKTRNDPTILPIVLRCEDFSSLITDCFIVYVNNHVDTKEYRLSHLGYQYK